MQPAAIRLRRLPIADLKPAPYNPRIALLPGSERFRRLERSLREFSLVEPIVWNEQTGHVVSGHQRLAVLKHQGVAEVDVSVVSLSAEREKALNVTLNNAQVGGDWDAGKLVDLVAELDELPNFDATLTGFDESDLRDLLYLPGDDDAEPGDSDGEGEARVQVSLQIPADEWEAVRADLDPLIARHELVVHVKLPRGG